jgi:hypothetical protein
MKHLLFFMHDRLDSQAVAARQSCQVQFKRKMFFVKQQNKGGAGAHLQPSYPRPVLPWAANAFLF